MRRALFAFFENPYGDTGRALREQVALIREAERLGLEEAWVSEHHFNDYSVSGPILPLMAYLCGVTERIRIGSAAVLLPYHTPLMVAETLAVMEQLNPGRIRFGMAKGAFPMDDRHFRSDPLRNREALYEAAVLIRRLLQEESVSFEGEYFSLERASVVPAPSGPIPSYVATFGSEESVRFAAEQGFGLMMGQTATLEQVHDASTLYERISGRRPDLVVLRLCSIDGSADGARVRAVASAHGFSERMRRVKAGRHAFEAGAFDGTRTALFEPHPMAERGIVGTPDMCRKQLWAHKQAGVTSLAIRPAGGSFEENRSIVGAFAALSNRESGTEARSGTGALPFPGR
jgi:alkanesulfonate monooxygenase SsuD/methylene tetrahydromethanopterin reductase-like flavin-dependent oxidoreductase (luciferase family)